MPTSATGTSTSNATAVTPPARQPAAHRAPRQRGFTLLELLVVVLIIGVTLGLVVPSLNPDRGRDLEEESRRLAALIRLGAEEAVLQGREYAVELAPDGYRFLALEGDKWLPLQDELLRPRQLPADIRLEVFYEGERFDFLRRGQDEEEPPQPRLYILSSGEMTPMEILFTSSASDRRYRLVIDINGKLRLES